MLKVINVSRRSITIDKIKLNSMESYVFDENNLSEYAKQRINSLVDMGLLKIQYIKEKPQPVVIKANTNNENVVVSETSEESTTEGTKRTRKSNK